MKLKSNILQSLFRQNHKPEGKWVMMGNVIHIDLTEERPATFVCDWCGGTSRGSCNTSAIGTGYSNSLSPNK